MPGSAEQEEHENTLHEPLKRGRPLEGIAMQKPGLGCTFHARKETGCAQTVAGRHTYQTEEASFARDHYVSVLMPERFIWPM